ncbi:MAG: CoB--CoM heterodisulfide reductase iron-sulfur subunit C [Promethearchaeota archaeon]|nr:MAG: CoB--CoM heterodisulfide reductase iron-sulfur subunit C [Candidatus Lokiarchaeota archaeon]
MAKQSQSKEWNYEFFKTLVKDVKENRNIIQCISCGKCVGDCPAAKISDFNIRKIISKVLRGDKSVLKDSDIWYCFLCERCKRVCPKEGINIPLLILNLRNESFKKGYGPKYNDLTKYVEMSERFLTNGTVLPEPLDGGLPEKRVNELDEICNFARIKYVFNARKNNSKKKKKDKD